MKRRLLLDWLDSLGAPRIAWMIDQGWLQSWPLELTRSGRRRIKALMRDNT
jgi:hypothetical protein